MLTLKKLKNFKKTKFSEKNKIIKEVPFMKGICLKIFSKKPKKPNSANSKVVKVKFSSGLLGIAFIPGENRNLNERSIVLVKRGKSKDLPGVKFKVISNKWDCGPVLNSKTSSSKYGASKID